MKRILQILIFLIYIVPDSFGQELYYVQENFERTDSAYYWLTSPIIPNKQWKYTFGGQWKVGSDPYNPEIPKQGNYNAGLYFPALTLDSVKLISPALELNGAKKPILRFWHCQYDKIVKGPDFLKLLFRAGPNSPWDVIQKWKNPINTWEDEIFNIADKGTKYLTDTFQFAFEGIIGNGYGVYIDSVTVLEEEIVPKYVKRTTYYTVDHTYIPSGATDIPLQRVKLRILGNTGKASLDSLTVIPQGVGVNYIEPSSFKLFYTVNDLFEPYIADTSTLVSTATLSGGKVVFANINHDMQLGDNNFWIVASFKNTIVGETSVSFSVPTNGINVSDTIFPASPVSFGQNHIIKESVFYDNFETGGNGWSLEGNFEVGWPEGNMVGIQSNPSTPYNGTKILATDLNGGYFPNIDSNSAYYAYTPELDLTYYFNVGLYMQTYFSINGPDNAVMDVSTDGGISWQNLWTSDPSSNNSYWTEFINSNLNSIASRKSKFQLRLGIVESKSDVWPGFSIDNFAIVAQKLYTDLGITRVLDPYSECRGCGNDTVRVWIKNYAINNSPAVIPLYYGLWGPDTILVRDTLYATINKDDSVLFTFSKTANFPKGDFYDKFIVGIDLASDQDPTNDTVTKPLIIQNYLTPPFTEDFEYKGGIWLKEENSTWINKNMSGTIPTNPLSPNIWVLSATGNYSNNDTSYVVSGCYNLNDNKQDIIQYKYWSDCEYLKDGARFEYSADNGNTWHLLEDAISYPQWNWATENVEALGSKGWSGVHDWTTAKALLPEAVDTLSKVKFRLVFMSDAVNSQAQGFAFDDLSMFPAPPDIGVSYIDVPKNACQYVNPDSVKLYIKNYGFTPITTEDTVVVGINFESQAPVIKSIHLPAELSPGDSVAYMTYFPMNIDNPGIYDIFAYTIFEDDPYYYGSNNDTAWKSFNVWLNPSANLVDTIFSRRPDTVVIRATINPKYSYDWSNSTHNSYCNVDKAGYYYVTVTESDHNCQSTDSTLVQLLFNDVGISQILSPSSSCELGTSEYVMARIHNYGTDSLIIGDKIKLYHQINGGTIYQDSVILTSSLRSGHNYDFTFTKNAHDFTAKGDYTIKSYAYFGGDTIPFNDTTTNTISVYGYPKINLGNDTTVKAVSYTLEAASGFSSYIWNDGDTNQTKLITSPGSYSITANDIHGCPAHDTIKIWLKIRDIKPINIASPLSSCDRTENDKVYMIIQNYGTDTLKLTDDIYVSFKMNTSETVLDTIHVNNLLPGQNYQYNFAPEVNLQSFGTYAFKLSASTKNDLRLENDTTTKVVFTSPNPVVDLGIEDDEVYKQTSYTFDAGTGPNWSYLWQDGSTDRYFTATNRGTIKLLVTDTATGCYGGDTNILYLDILDYRVMDISISNTPCQGIHNDVSVTVRNSGNLSRGGAEFTLQYILGNTVLHTENQEWTKNWSANQNQTFYTTLPINLSNTGTDNLRVIIKHEGDLRPENDTLNKGIDIKPKPQISLGGPTIYTDLPYTINAGSGYTSYLWNTGATSSSITVTQNAVYTVTVTGTNGCEASSSVGINVVLSVNAALSDAIDLKVYPNPASDNVNIEAVFKESGNYILEIYNTQNSLVLSQDVNTYDYKENIYIGNLSPGLYFVRIRNNTSYQIAKLIIQ